MLHSERLARLPDFKNEKTDLVAQCRQELSPCRRCSSQRSDSASSDRPHRPSACYGRPGLTGTSGEGGTLIMGQYSARMRLTASLLLPLVSSALFTNGYGHKSTLAGKAGAQVASRGGTLHHSSRCVREFCRPIFGMSFRRPMRSSKHAHEDSNLKSVNQRSLLHLYSSFKNSMLQKS